MFGFPHMRPKLLLLLQFKGLLLCKITTGVDMKLHVAVNTRYKHYQCILNNWNINLIASYWFCTILISLGSTIRLSPIHFDQYIWNSSSYLLSLSNYSLDHLYALAAECYSQLSHHIATKHQISVFFTRLITTIAASFWWWYIYIFLLIMLFQKFRY